MSADAEGTRERALMAMGGGLDRDHPVMRLWRLAKRDGIWDPMALDLEQDRADWEGVAADERQVLEGPPGQGFTWSGSEPIMEVANGEPEPGVQRFTIETTLVIEGNQDPDGWADAITMFVQSLDGFVDEGMSGVSRVRYRDDGS